MTNTVLYFEDTKGTADDVIAGLQPLLDGIAVVEKFEATERTGEMYDARLEREIAARQASGKRIVFILSDADLATTNNFEGLSDSNVQKVAAKLGIPSAYYSSNLDDMAFLKADQSRDSRILLDKRNIPDMCEEAACLVKGFISIAESLNQLFKLESADRPRDVAELLAGLLGRPELKNRVKLYIAGDARLGAEILHAPTRSSLGLAAVLGAAIYDTLLKYPGLTLNAVAAASYLNISVDDFAAVEIRNLFEDAIYSGPFSSQARPVWWRDMLDEQLLEGGDDVEDGQEYVKLMLDRDVAPCLCSETNAEPAGYYCMIKRMPVCEDHSVGGLSWFPLGADLARISSDKYDELLPWLA